MKIAIQGERGAFSHVAAETMVPGCEVVSCERSINVFDQLENGKVDAAVIPIENTLAGSVAEHYDLLFSRHVFIEKEFRLRIVHNLIVTPGVKLSEIRKIYSHPIALDQCRYFLQKMKQVQVTPFYDTAGSVRQVVLEEQRDAAGIASELAAKEYGGHILKRDIEDNKHNYTRFFLIKTKQKTLPKANKTSLAFALKNTPGALFKVLSVFALRDIDLSKIESRPVPGKPWEYLFYADIMCGNNQALQNALNHLKEVAEKVKILGIYPAAK